MRARWVLVLIGWSACGGAGARAGNPRDAVEQWREACRQDDPRAAYALLRPSLRGRIPYERFATRWRATAIERTAQAKELQADASPSLSEHARLTLADGKIVDLVREGDRWQLAAPVLSYHTAGTPQEALRQLAGALEARQLDGVLRVLSSTRRGAVQTMLDSFLAGLRRHLRGQIEISGERASLSWREGTVRFRITLVRENGQWRVDDVDLN